MKPYTTSFQVILPAKEQSNQVDSNFKFGSDIVWVSENDLCTRQKRKYVKRSDNPNNIQPLKKMRLSYILN